MVLKNEHQDYNSANKSLNSGFTIVELLVVIVVIAILAAITIVSYTGISQKAKAAALQSDLSNAATQLKLFQATDVNGDYPTKNNCPTPGATEICLKISNGNAYNYTPSNSTDTKTFTLDATNGTMTYRITNDSAPVNLAVTPISAIAATTGTTTAVGNTLTAGALTPAAATVSYQWQSSTTSTGTYTNISGVTANTYTLKISDVGDYLKVVATGTGIYSGTQTSTPSSQISDSNWLAVGTQVWAKANMNVGTIIAGVTAQTNNNIIERYCPNDTNANCIANGALYQWDEAMQYITTEGAQGICPVGSHIPTDNDWKILEIQLGMTQAQADATGERGTNQGTQLKSDGTSGLNMPLAGDRDADGSIGNLSSHTFLWSSSESSTSAWVRYWYSSNTTVYRSMYGSGYGFSIRCLGN